MDINGLSNDLTNCHSRIQGSGRILENDLHFSSVGKHFSSFGFSKRFAVFIQRIVVNGFAIINNLSSGWLIKAKNRSSQCGLSTSGLSYKTECFTFFDIKGNILYSLYPRTFYAVYRKILS